MAIIFNVNGIPTDTITVDAGVGNSVFSAILIITDAIVEAGENAIAASPSKVFVPLNNVSVFQMSADIGSIFVAGWADSTEGNCVSNIEADDVAARAQLTQFEFTPSASNNVEVTVTPLTSQSAEITLRGV